MPECAFIEAEGEADAVGVMGGKKRGGAGLIRKIHLFLVVVRKRTNW